MKRHRCGVCPTSGRRLRFSLCVCDTGHLGRRMASIFSNHTSLEPRSVFRSICIVGALGQSSSSNEWRGPPGAAAENSQSGGNLADTRVAEWDKEERVCLVLDSMHVVPASASDPACWHLIMQTFGFGHRSLWHWNSSSHFAGNHLTQS